MPDALFPVTVVRCFFGWCGHVETALDPAAAHAAMQAHYDEDHDGDLAELTGPVWVRVLPGTWWVIR
jgi:hypothetical protein